MAKTFKEPVPLNQNCVTMSNIKNKYYQTALELSDFLEYYIFTSLHIFIKNDAPHMNTCHMESILGALVGLFLTIVS